MTKEAGTFMSSMMRKFKEIIATQEEKIKQQEDKVRKLGSTSNGHESVNNVVLLGEGWQKIKQVKCTLLWDQRVWKEIEGRD